MVIVMATLEPEMQHEMLSKDPMLSVNVTQNSTSQYEDIGASDETMIFNILSIVIPILFGLIAVIGICGNLLVIIVVVSNKQMRNSTNMLIINLALADLIFIVICVPFTAVGYVIPVWPFGEVFCKFYNYMINMTAYASVYTLVLMSLDRYLAVCHPIWSMGLRTERNALIIILISWVVIVVVTIPIIFEYGVMAINGEEKLCLNTKIREDDVNELPPKSGRIFYGVFFVFGYLLPLTLVCVLYGLLLKRLLCGMTPGGYQSAESMRGKKRVTKMVVVVVCVFAICWLPIHIRYLIHFFGKYHENAAFYIFQVIATCLAYVNSCVNPILYAFLSDNFRKSFRKLLCCYSNFQPMHIDYERTQCQPREQIEFSKTYSTNCNAVDNNCNPENNGKVMHRKS